VCRYRSGGTERYCYPDTWVLSILIRGLCGVFIHHREESGRRMERMTTSFSGEKKKSKEKRLSTKYRDIKGKIPIAVVQKCLSLW
jgi:hypothetical protein